MLATVRPFDAAAYQASRVTLMTLLEGNFLRPYVDSEGIPTIGIGINIRDVPANFNAFITVAGLGQFSQAIQNVVNLPYNADGSGNGTGASSQLLQVNINNALGLPPGANFSLTPQQSLGPVLN